MNPLDYFLTKGLMISPTEDDRLSIRGISSLPGALKNQVLEYARINKQQILFEARMQDSRVQGPDSPLLCPARCRGSGKCFGLPYFKGRPGKPKECIPNECAWKNQLNEYQKNIKK